MNTELATRPDKDGYAMGNAPHRLFRPPVDIRETEDAVLIDLDMPGVDPGDVDVTLENRVLTIRGHITDGAREGWTPVFREYGEGDYQRAFTVSEDVDVESIKANCRRGVLHLELPKAAEVRPRRIKVRGD